MRKNGRHRVRHQRRAGYSAVVLAGLMAVGSAGTSPWIGYSAGMLPSQEGSNAAHGPVGRLPVPYPPHPIPVAMEHDAVGQDTARPAFGIPAQVFDAYVRAVGLTERTDPGCHLTWPLLAAIGKVESNHADGGAVAANGDLVRPILGPVLDGSNGTAAVPGESGGRGNRAGRWARAEGPMQFLPSSWMMWGSDGNGDGVANPENIYDASLAAGHYLCAGRRDLSTATDLHEAVLSYNHSAQYLDLVLKWMQAYQSGGGPVASQETENDLADATYDSEYSDSRAAESQSQGSSPAAPPNPSSSGPAPSTGGQKPPQNPPGSPQNPGGGVLPPPVGGLIPAPVNRIISSVVPPLAGANNPASPVAGVARPGPRPTSP